MWRKVHIKGRQFYLDELVSVSTVAIHTIFLIKQFPSNGHLFFSLQLHDFSAIFSM